tara:strand:- start:69 stop:329 length:261 start_codon:yes stop_codon:yes gene_type:complete
MNHYTYAICDVATDLPNVDFSQVITTSAETIRKSIDETLFVIKWWDGVLNIPSFISDGTIVPSETLNQDQALTLMATAAWTEESPE